MGSDSAPDLLFQGVIQAVRHLDAIESFVVIVTEYVMDELKELCESYADPAFSRMSFLTVSQYISMDDAPLLAVRRKTDSSMIRGLQLLQQGEVQAFVTAGHTGALIAGAKMHIPMLSRVKKPALLTMFPSIKNPLAVLDVGGSVGAEAEDLVQYAYMGVAYQNCILGIDKPHVGLLNIGSESRRGTKEIQQAYKILQDLGDQNMIFMGNVEGKNAFDGKLDVLVTNGFSGNIFLKTSEGLSWFLLESLKEAFASSGMALPSDILVRMQHKFAYDEYPGAVVCGVEKIVVKCHGYSTSKAIYHGIKGALSLWQHHFISKMESKLAR